MSEQEDLHADVLEIRAAWGGREQDILSDATAERTTPNANLKTVVSVRFTPEDVATVAAAAERTGQAMSTFIRSAALAAAKHQYRQKYDPTKADLGEQVAQLQAELKRSQAMLRELVKAPVDEPNTRYRPYALADPH